MKTGFTLLTASVLTLLTGSLANIQQGPARQFLVSLYLFDMCETSFYHGIRYFIADGQCQAIAPSRVSADVEPGPYYRAITDATGSQIQFLNAQCTDSTCTNCAGFSYWTTRNQGIFDMTNRGCTDVETGSFIAMAPGVLLNPADGPAPTPAPVSTQVQAPTPAVSLPAANITAPYNATCAWAFRYYDRSQQTSFFGSCSVVGLVPPSESATIIPDGTCRNSGTASVGFYQAMCDPNGGIIFLQNKCLDATCAVCDTDSDVYPATAYMPGVCYNHDSSIFQSWVLQGSCSALSCNTTSLPDQDPLGVSLINRGSLP